MGIVAGLEQNNNVIDDFMHSEKSKRSKEEKGGVEEAKAKKTDPAQKVLEVKKEEQDFEQKQELAKKPKAKAPKVKAEKKPQGILAKTFNWFNSKSTNQKLLMGGGAVGALLLMPVIVMIAKVLLVGSAVMLGLNFFKGKPTKNNSHKATNSKDGTYLKTKSKPAQPKGLWGKLVSPLKGFVHKISHGLIDTADKASGGIASKLGVKDHIKNVASNALGNKSMKLTA